MISIFLPHLRVGGAERVNLNLGYEFARKGHVVEFVLLQAEGELLSEAQSSFSVVNLNCSRLRSLPKILLDYLHKRRPDNIIVSIWPLTVLVALAKIFYWKRCKVIICEHNNLSVQYRKWGWVHRFFMKSSMFFGYRLANARVGVSKGVVNDIAKLSGLSKKMFEVIYNPVNACSQPSTEALKNADKLWSCPSGARIVTVGNLTEQKNHKLLLNSFARMGIAKSRLMFVGDGKGRESIILQARELGIDDKIILAGFQADPTPFYKTADLFVLSSDYEGLPLVVIEALACGLPIVSTDCPSGPSEILVNGRYGHLVPVGDENSLTNAMGLSLNTPQESAKLIKRSEDFSPENISNKYLKLLDEII